MNWPLCVRFYLGSWWAPWPILEKYPNYRLSIFCGLCRYPNRSCPSSLNTMKKDCHHSFIYLFIFIQQTFIVSIAFQECSGPWDAIQWTKWTNPLLSWNLQPHVMFLMYIVWLNLTVPWEAFYKQETKVLEGEMAGPRQNTVAKPGELNSLILARTWVLCHLSLLPPVDGREYLGPWRYQVLPRIFSLIPAHLFIYNHLQHLPREQSKNNPSNSLF